MLMWDEGWPGLEAKLNEEHRQLHQLLDSMRAVIDTTPSRGLLAEALAVFAARLGLHFGMEEDLLRTRDPKAHAVLVAEHAPLMRQLTELGACPDRQKISAGILSLLQQLERHEREVDAELFREVCGNPQQSGLLKRA